MSRWKKNWRLVPLFAVMTFLLAGCGDPTLSALRPRGPVASEQLFLMKISIAIMLLVVVVVFALYLFVIIRFRKRKGQEGIPKQVEGNHVLEIVWTVIPILLLIVLAVPTVYYTFKHTTNYVQDKDAIHVKVTAHQFWWQFEYPELGISTAQDLVIPTGKNIALELTSADVTHSFWVPSLGGKMDTNTNMTNVYYLKADDVDVFKGKCAELCGASHSLMDFKVKSLAQGDFDAWVTNMQTPAAVPADAKQGEELFKQKCLQCHAIDPKGLGFGPNLNGYADREMLAGVLEHNDENLKKWIKDPQAEKPGTLMPKVPLEDNQVNEIVKYLNSLK
ncbi:cytochrome c oxidase subunit II [Paenibacillus chitinolyticus]|uniref:cytochrome c oxidase subunit II n=1 Tax=Paenibacillus chitinolyticus TaxID=79263 RepID=UPI002DB6BC98|nr:cytochrome c oxidase subunit II [Paenibacillus chitinolyticus]MEC0246931.1 cytochrome c oxidase subunit II [Paenibacillus chitinolyticus]